MSNWYDHNNADKVTRSGTWRIMAIIAAFTIFALLLGGVVWGFRVATAPVKGAGDAFQQQQSGNNRISSQARFEDLYADYEQTVNKIKPAKQALRQNPDSQIKQTELTGLTNYCLDVVGDYNAESRKYLAADFKAIDLPTELDSTRCS
jgi:hypothetical protein